MVLITLALLRKRAEHNEGCLADLKEITLHQQDIEKLSVIGDACRQLEILYLCNNYIPKIEGLKHLKCLKYLNLAVNNIQRIEGLEGCESLEKLDLTLNFIGDMTCVANLRANAMLENLHLTGNACTNVEGYRAYVIQTLPHLLTLDSEEVIRSEKIVARQDATEVKAVVTGEALKAREQRRLIEEMKQKGMDPFPPQYNDKGERLYGHSPEERMQMLREQEEQAYQRKNPPKDPNSISAIAEELNKKPPKLTPQEELEKYGRILLKNEGKLPYQMEEEEEAVVLTVEPGKFISTTLINVEVETTYVRVTVKGKLLQLVTPEEVCPSKVKVQRATSSGQLKITMPFAMDVLQKKREKKARRRYLNGEEDDDEDDKNENEKKKKTSEDLLAWLDQEEEEDGEKKKIIKKKSSPVSLLINSEKKNNAEVEKDSSKQEEAVKKKPPAVEVLSSSEAVVADID